MLCEQVGVGGLVPDKGARAPAPAAIELRQRLAEGDDPVIGVERECVDRRRIADGAVVRVVEQQAEAAAPGAGGADAADHLRLGPFVHQHELGALQCRLGLLGSAVLADRYLAEHATRVLERLRAVIGHEVRAAPALGRLDRLDRVAERRQFAEHTAQEMSVAVVPAREQRVGELDDPHRATPRRHSAAGP
ncbi:MAG TPA: hypothetical protein VMM55_01795 [Thermohalobaculum sp.]|nr:hypothetical protein [Thermohalobaculum sp.]